MSDSDRTDERSVTEWLNEVKRGDEGIPQQQLMKRFLGRLEALARKRLQQGKGYEDEQDVALSAMKSFFMSVPEREDARLTDRKSLWTLLAAITVNKALTAQRKQLAQKRDARRVVSFEESGVAEPQAELVDSMVGEGNRLLESLEDGALRKIARMRLEGYKNEEIASAIGRSVKTVERKLGLIRKQLRNELDRRSEEGGLPSTD